MKKKTIIIFILLCLVYGFFVVEKIDLTNSDLGRHLKNGEMILRGEGDVLSTNFYSYTNPDYQIINHHWLSGVAFFLIYKISGFSGLTVFYLILSLIIFTLIFYLAREYGGLKVTFIVSLLIMPLLIERTEIRPEIFSALFSILFFYLLFRNRQHKVSDKWLFVLPVLQIFWINLHLYFFLGPLILVAFLLDQLIMDFNKEKIKKYILILILVVLVMLINPMGLKGVLYPLNVFKDFGYRVAEVQSVWFMDTYNNQPGYWFFKASFLLLLLSFAFVIFFDKENFSLGNFFLAAGLSVMAWLMVRHIPLFGFFALPIIAINLQKLRKYKKSLAVISLIAVIFMFFQAAPRVQAHQHNFGIGLISNNDSGAKFFKEQKIQGPIFNNYDIGGYLIYYLYPEEKVFVDNRPAEYPSSFFKEVYIPLQEDEEHWRQADKKYKFNVIFFYYRDLTPWSQKFLIARINDSDWAPVFADDKIIIFLKRNDLNKKIIEAYELPQNYFSITR